MSRRQNFLSSKFCLFCLARGVGKMEARCNVQNVFLSPKVGRYNDQRGSIMGMGCGYYGPLSTESK